MTVTVEPPAQWGGSTDPLQSSGGAAGTLCATAAAVLVGVGGPWSSNLAGPQCHYDPATNSDWVRFPLGSSHTTHESCTESGNDGTGTSWSSSLTTDLTFSSPGVVSPGGTGPGHGGGGGGGASAPKLTPIKNNAKKDFARAWDDALGPCSQLAMGLGVLATGGVWVSASATVPGGIPAGGAVIATGQVMSSVASALCARKLKRLLDDYRIFNDPPDPHFGRLAWVARRSPAPTLHACGGLAGSVRSFCLKLSSLAAKLVVAARNTTAVDDALLTTVNRASGAFKARRTAAFNAQLRHATNLEPQFTAALRSEASLGRAIKRLISAGDLTLAQATATTTYLEQKLGRGGISLSAIGRIDPTALTATAEDPTTRLAKP